MANETGERNLRILGCDILDESYKRFRSVAALLMCNRTQLFFKDDRGY